MSLPSIIRSNPGLYQGLALGSLTGIAVKSQLHYNALKNAADARKSAKLAKRDAAHGPLSTRSSRGSLSSSTPSGSGFFTNTSFIDRTRQTFFDARAHPASSFGTPVQHKATTSASPRSNAFTAPTHTLNRQTNYFTSSSFVAQTRQAFATARAQQSLVNRTPSTRAYSTQSKLSAPQPRNLSSIAPNGVSRFNMFLDDFVAWRKGDLARTDLYLKYPDLDVGEYQARFNALVQRLKGGGESHTVGEPVRSVQRTTPTAQPKGEVKTKQHQQHVPKTPSSVPIFTPSIQSKKPVQQLGTFSLNQQWKTNVQRSAIPHSSSAQRTPVARIDTIKAQVCEHAEHAKAYETGRNATQPAQHSNPWVSTQSAHQCTESNQSVHVSPKVYIKISLLPRGIRFDCQWHREHVARCLDSAKPIKRKDVALSQILTLDNRTTCLALQYYLGSEEAVNKAVLARFPRQNITQGRKLLVAKAMGIRTVAKAIPNRKERAHLTVQESARQLVQDLRISRG